MNSGDLYWTEDGFADTVDDIHHALPALAVGADRLDDEGVEQLLAQATAGLSDLEAESVGSALRKVGQWVSNQSELREAAGSVLPVAGAAIGTVYGGPAGTAIGGAVGQHAGKIIAGKPAVKTAPVVATNVSPPAAAVSAASPLSGSPPGQGSDAAAKLLYLVQNPAFLSSLLALVLGPRGQPGVAVGGNAPVVPVGAFLTAASALTGQAASDAESFIGDSGLSSNAYLNTGDCESCDAAAPEGRAERLIALLQQSDLSGSSFESYDDPIEDESANAWWDDEAWWDDDQW